MSQTCFACDCLATTREHAPPKCIFPESKDANGKNFRRNLITVPACDLHNLSKSRDDEYLMCILASYGGNNITGQQHFLTKVDRAFARAIRLGHSNLAAVVLKNPLSAYINGEEGLTYQLDLERFNRCIDLIARAVVFHQDGEKWSEPSFVRSSCLLPRHPENLVAKFDEMGKILDLVASTFEDVDFIGETREVFQYRIYYPITHDAVKIVQMLFYGTFEVSVFFSEIFS